MVNHSYAYWQWEIHPFSASLFYIARNEVHNELSDRDPSWTFDDASFEKMGVLMKMSAFLTQINLYCGRGLSDSHEMALFLQLYNGHPWRRDTSQCVCLIITA